jgi:hypothetical protein
MIVLLMREAVMDAPTASVLAAVITAAASIAVALITSRRRIDVLPPVSRKEVRTPANTPSTNQDRAAPASDLTSENKAFRFIGWVLMIFVFLLAALFIVVSVAGFHEFYLHPASSSNFWLASSLVLFGVFLIWIGIGGSRRLRRRRASNLVAPPPQSN